MTGLIPTSRYTCQFLVEFTMSIKEDSITKLEVGTMCLLVAIPRLRLSQENSHEKATDDVKGLSPEEMLGVKEWLDFYRKDYSYVGKLIGRYYDSEGNPTEALNEAKIVIKEGQKLKKLQEAENKRYPGCNSKWNAEEGSTVWCSKNSGGISRNWVGVPRKMFKPGKKDSKCVCVKTTGPSSESGEGNDGDLNNPIMKQYPGCGKYDVSCKL